MFRALALSAVLLAAAAALPSCVQRLYEVRMSPRAGGGWDRVLTVTEHRHERDAEGRDVPTQETRISPSSFSRDIGSDVGNAGSITTYRTSLGTLTIYVERIRGQSAVADTVESKIHAAGEAARLIGGWLRSEAPNWPGATDLHRWCEEDLRADLRDLTVHLWLTGVDRGGARDPAHSAGWLRVLQFLTERGYVQPDELAQLSRLLMGGAESDEVHRWWVRMIARKAGDLKVAAGGEPPPFLRSWEATAASLESYLQQQPEFAALVAEAQARAKPDESPERIDAKQVLGDRLAAMSEGMVPLFASETGNWAETLDLELATPVEPFATNGRWRPDRKVVRWFTMLDGPDQPAMYPLNLYAQWVMVDEEAQRACFGEVALNGVLLAKYCLWRSGLTDIEGRAWDEALAGLAPNAEIAPILKEAAAKSGMPAPLCDQGIGMIQDGLYRTRTVR